MTFHPKISHSYLSNISVSPVMTVNYATLSNYAGSAYMYTSNFQYLNETPEQKIERLIGKYDLSIPEKPVKTKWKWIFGVMF